MFAIGGWGSTASDELESSELKHKTANNRVPAFTFKVSRMNFELLKEEAGYRPSPYLASRGFTWIQQTDTAGNLDEELRYYIALSHALVASSLSKKKQRELGL